MMRRVLRMLVALLLGVLTSWVWATPQFVAKPTARAERAGVHIEFAVSEPTDVAVAILDAKGDVVRHLAAGLLGKNAPPPLKKDSLVQSLLWDRKDDAGQPLPAGKYAIKVSIGLQPSLDRLLGWKRQTLGSVRGLAVGKQGDLFVLNTVGSLHSGDGTTVCQVFDRGGKYLRTIMPYPANLFPQKTKGFGLLELGADGQVPFIHHAENRSIYPLAREATRQQMVITPDGRLIQVAIGGTRRYTGPALVRLLATGLDGSAPRIGVLGPVLARESFGDISLALAADRKTFYATGFVSGPSTNRQWHQVVYRCGWQDGEAKPFLGSLNESGSDEYHLDNPVSIAVDGKGNIYVADRGNDRIVIFGPEGTFLGSLAVAKPGMLALHRKSGAIYVLAGSPEVELLKFANWKRPEPVARMSILRLRHPDNRTTQPVLAVDDEAKQAIVWIGSPTSYTVPVAKLLRMRDLGSSFSPPQEMARGKEGLTSFSDIAVDRTREKVYLRLSGDRYARINGHTGKTDILSPPGSYHGGTILTVSPDGSLYMYAHNWPNFVARFDHDLKPLAFAAQGLPKFIPDAGSMHLMARGFAVTPVGDMYIMQENVGGTEMGKGRHLVNVYGPDGTLKRKGIISGLHRGACSVRLDNQGNIYVASNSRPGKALFPLEFKGKVPEGQRLSDGMLNWYPVMYGSIIKFGPEGGSVWQDIGGRKANYAYHQPTEVKGALWQYLGASPVPAWYGHASFGHYINGCICEQSRFDVDEFGRVFLPDVARFRVVVLDTNGNEILAFGSYGNQDSAGPNSAIPEPEIAFAWPSQVAVSDEAVYVGDVVSRRVVRLKLRYAAEAMCEIK